MKLYAALLAGLVACGMVMASDSAATSAAPATEKAAPAKKAAVAKTQMVSGSVVSVDAIANTVIVEATKGKKTIQDTLYTTDKTTMPKGKTLADLKAGDKVTVMFKVEEGKKTATKIAEKAAAVKKAPKAAKKDTVSAAPEAPKAGAAK